MSQTVPQMLACYKQQFDTLYRQYKQARSRRVKGAKAFYHRQAEALFMLIDLLSACAPKEKHT